MFSPLASKCMCPKNQRMSLALQAKRSAWRRFQFMAGSVPALQSHRRWQAVSLIVTFGG
jgi:hypothetical protein